MPAHHGAHADAHRDAHAHHDHDHDHDHGPEEDSGDDEAPSTGFLPMGLAISLFVTGLFVLGLVKC